MARETDLMNLMNRIESLESQVRFLSRLESGGGKVIAVKSAVFTGTQAVSVGGNDDFNITNLSITHALSKSTNKVILWGHVGVLASSRRDGRGGLRFYKGSSVILNAGASGDKTSANSSFLTSGSDSPNGYLHSALTAFGVYSPGSVSSNTYYLRAVNSIGLTKTIYINRTESDMNVAGFCLGISSFVLFEVAE